LDLSHLEGLGLQVLAAAFVIGSYFLAEAARSKTIPAPKAPGGPTNA